MTMPSCALIYSKKSEGKNDARGTYEFTPCLLPEVTVAPAHSVVTQSLEQTTGSTRVNGIFFFWIFLITFAIPQIAT